MATTWETPQSFKESGVSSAAFYELAVRFVLGRFTPDNRYGLALFLPASIFNNQQRQDKCANHLYTGCYRATCFS